MFTLCASDKQFSNLVCLVIRLKGQFTKDFLLFCSCFNSSFVNVNNFSEDCELSKSGTIAKETLILMNIVSYEQC